jgi:phage repressor protein C with HTH and peptisase S24 domain
VTISSSEIAVKHFSATGVEFSTDVVIMKVMQNRIRELRHRAGLSMQALADRAGTSAPQINKLEKGERRLTVDWMVRLGKALGVDPTELLPPHISQGRSAGLGMSDSMATSPLEIGQADLPVLGRAQGGRSGVLMIPAEQTPVDRTYRPPQLRGVRDAFAVFAYDDSMHPMYKHGQTLWVHPYLPVKAGDGVLVIKQSDEAIVKELVRRSDHEVVLKQYRPSESDFALPVGEIRAIYRVIGALDLR